MKISKDKYEKALKAIPKLRQSEQIVKEWEAAKKSHPSMFEQAEVVEIERIDGKPFKLTVQRKDNQTKLVDS